MADEDWKVEAELEGLNGILVVQHRTCGRRTRVPFDQARGIHHCGCGAEISFSGDDLRELQKALDGLKNLFR